MSEKKPGDTKPPQQKAPKSSNTPQEPDTKGKPKDKPKAPAKPEKKSPPKDTSQKSPKPETKPPAKDKSQNPPLKPAEKKNSAPKDKPKKSSNDKPQEKTNSATSPPKNKGPPPPAASKPVQQKNNDNNRPQDTTKPTGAGAAQDQEDPNNNKSKSEPNCCCCCKCCKKKDERLANAEEYYRECTLCCCRSILYHDQDPESGERSHQTCCTKNCECKFNQVLCVLIWIVMVLCVVFSIVFYYKTYDFLEVIFWDDDVIAWYLTFAFLIFVFVSSILFLGFTKCQCGSGCCCVYNSLWLLIHIVLGFIVYWFIYTTDIPSSFEALQSVQAYVATNSKPGPPWLKYLQDENFCCLKHGTTHYGTEPGYSQKCKQYVVPATGEYNEHLTTCDVFLTEIYSRTMNLAGIFVIIIMILGVIPLVIFWKVYSKVKRFNRLSPLAEEPATANPTSNNNDGARPVSRERPAEGPTNKPQSDPQKSPKKSALKQPRPVSADKNNNNNNNNNNQKI